MQHRHMRHAHPSGSRVLGKIVLILLIIGALFATRSHSYRNGYWDGFTVGSLQSEAPAASAETAAPAPPQFNAPMPGGPNQFGGPPLGLFFLLPLCVFGAMGLMSVMFMGSRMARRRGRWGHGRPPWSEKGNDDDDEIGPEKQPEDLL